MLIHYYHVYADGAWHLPVQEHLQALNESGLITVLDAKRVGIVGKPHNREQVKDLLVPLGWEVVAETDAGYEQVTLNSMKWLPEDKILYAHTKGAYDNSSFRHEWRRAMNDCVIRRWRRCVVALDEVDAVGGYWFWRRREDIPHHFAGNFWWTKGEYLAKVPFPISEASRWDAEFYPFQQVNKVLDIHTGPPIHSNWAHRRINEPPPPGHVRFISYSKVMHYRPNRVYVEPLTPILEKLLENGVNLRLLPHKDEDYEHIYSYKENKIDEQTSNFQSGW